MRANPLPEDISDAAWAAAVHRLTKLRESVVWFVPSRRFADSIDENGDPTPSCMSLDVARQMCDREPRDLLGPGDLVILDADTGRPLVDRHEPPPSESSSANS